MSLLQKSGAYTAVYIRQAQTKLKGDSSEFRNKERAR